VCHHHTNPRENATPIDKFEKKKKQSSAKPRQFRRRLKVTIYTYKYCPFVSVLWLARSYSTVSPPPRMDIEYIMTEKEGQLKGNCCARWPMRSKQRLRRIRRKTGTETTRNCRGPGIHPCFAPFRSGLGSYDSNYCPRKRQDRRTKLGVFGGVSFHARAGTAIPFIQCRRHVQYQLWSFSTDH
jgi:hypothetical protein